MIWSPPTEVDVKSEVRIQYDLSEDMRREWKCSRWRDVDGIWGSYCPARKPLGSWVLGKCPVGSSPPGRMVSLDGVGVI